MKKRNIIMILAVVLLLSLSVSAYAESESKIDYKMNLMEEALYVDVKVDTSEKNFKFAIDVPKGAEVYDVEGNSLREHFLSGDKYIFDFEGANKEVSYKIKGLNKAFKRADGFVFGLYRSFNNIINAIDVHFDSVYYDEPKLTLYDSLSSLNTEFEPKFGPAGLFKITAPIDLALGVKYPKNEFVNAPYEDMDFEDYRNDELSRIQLKRIDKPGVSELILKGIIAIALLGFVIVGFLMTKNQRFKNKFRVKKNYEDKELEGKTFDLKTTDKFLYLAYQFYDIKEDRVASYLGVDESDGLVEKKLTASYEALLKEGYIEKEDYDYSVALTKKGRLMLEEMLIKKEYLLSKDNLDEDEDRFMRLFG